MSAVRSFTITLALSIKTPFELIVTTTSVPFKVVTIWLFDNIVDITLSPTTWWSNILVNCGISFNKAGTVPAGNALNATSVGANNVNGPGPDKVASNEQASIAAFNVVWSVELETISYIEFPPQSFQYGLAGLSGNTNISVAASVMLLVSLIKVTEWVTKS